jgi:hypothetical protein
MRFFKQNNHLAEQGCPQLSAHQFSELARLRADGLSGIRIAVQLGVSKMTVYRAAYWMDQEQKRQKSNASVALYRNEKARRDERRPRDAALIDAKEDFIALLEREKARGRGGRPKGAKPTNPVQGDKPGKPRLFVQRTAAVDALIESLPPFYGNGAARLGGERKG